jgi:Na+/H+-dicarboxylate symporter
MTGTEAKKCCSPVGGMNKFFIIAVVCGLLAGFADHPMVYSAASVVSDIFISLLKLVSLPIIFLSIVSTASGMESISEIKHLGKKVIKYTLFTTIIAASVALVLFIAISPVRSQVHGAGDGSAEAATQSTNYLTHLMHVIPSNIVQPFSENNVIGVLFIALILSLAMLTLPQENRKTLNNVFSSLYAAIMKITAFIVRLMPIAVAAFIALFFRDLSAGLEFKNLALYLAVVVLANLFQALVVLPIFLKFKGISPWKMMKGMFPALSVAFFTKSSSAALPMAIKCAEENIKVSKKVAGFSLPLCTTINMNGCAAFILTTVLFVSMSNGFTYSYVEMFTWIFIATIAAVGNAGVPMGCFFLSSAFLAAMNVPLNILGVILPFYTLIDMLESAINVWSDACVTAAVDSEVREPVAVVS